MITYIEESVCVQGEFPSNWKSIYCSGSEMKPYVIEASIAVYEGSSVVCHTSTNEYAFETPVKRTAGMLL